jgi:hypothetical protein
MVKLGLALCELFCICIPPLAALSTSTVFLNTSRKIIEHLFPQGLPDFPSTLDYVVNSLFRISHICKREAGQIISSFNFFCRFSIGFKSEEYSIDGL